MAGQFYLQFALSLTHDMLAVLTDKEHEPGFKLQCAVRAPAPCSQSSCCESSVFGPPAAPSRDAHRL